MTINKGKQQRLDTKNFHAVNLENLRHLEIDPRWRIDFFCVCVVSHSLSLNINNSYLL